MTQPVRVVLNTRHGSLRGAGDFSSCKWYLPDPIISPGDDHRLFVDVAFTTIPCDHKRITDQRGTTLLRLESRVQGSGEIRQHTVRVAEGSYNREGYLKAINKAIIERIHKDLKGEEAVMSDWYAPVQFVRANDADLHEHETQEVLLHAQPLSDTEFRVVHDNVHMAAEALGFHATSGWTGPEHGQVSNSVMDTQGTRTITICATELAGNHPDPVRMERRRSVLRVLPVMEEESHRPVVWYRPSCKDGHPIGSRCLTCIELHLRDDMDFPFNPRHH